MIQSNMEFSDKVYERGLEIERYEKQSKLLSTIQQEKREYALLKFQFWLNAIKLREFCNADYSTLIYFYKDKPSGAEEIYQKTESQLLLELKHEFGPNLILVPLAIDLDVESVELLVEQFNIQEVPSVVINEEIVLSGVVSKQVIIQELNRARISSVA